MKIIVFSDSHRVISLMAEAVRREKPDLVLHLGDHASDAAELSAMFPAVRLAYVRGNCDHNSQ
ncbi:MAG: metallophosphoesterase family protein, partial [Oscillospiraceae bacterium]|nr:metallophosphoesterase family protein [Oscillospiraceae bacterium]